MLHHITLASKSRQPLFPDESRLRAAVRKMAEVFPDEMALFCLVDDHLHSPMFGDWQTAGRQGQRLAVALGPLVSVELQPAHRSPIETRAHMRRVLPYDLQQPVSHELGQHPALYSGSCLQDLLNARVLEGLRLRIKDALPRYHPRDACAAVGLGWPVLPANDDQIRGMSAARLAAAASSALAADPALKGNWPHVVRARRAAAQLASQLGFSTTQLARTLGVSPVTLRRYCREREEAAVIQAIRMRLGLELAVAAQSLADF